MEQLEATAKLKKEKEKERKDNRTILYLCRRIISEDPGLRKPSETTWGATTASTSTLHCHRSSGPPMHKAPMSATYQFVRRAGLVPNETKTRFQMPVVGVLGLDKAMPFVTLWV